jgi:V/A-type H+-transporting ATPase subunit F
MYKIAVMGGSDTVLGFKALGLDTFPVTTQEEARAALRKLVVRESSDDPEYAIIYIEERLAQLLQAEIAQFSDKVTPAIILIPGRDGSLGLSLTALHDAVVHAIGADIL